MANLRTAKDLMTAAIILLISIAIFSLARQVQTSERVEVSYDKYFVMVQNS
jgi:hypothetical protein